MSEVTPPYGPPRPLPETPDFEQIAQRLARSVPGLTGVVPLSTEIAFELRQVWNARGAADLKAIRDAPLGVGIARTEAIDRLRTLDR